MDSRLARSIDWPARPGHVGVVVRISVSVLFCTASVVLVDLLFGAALGETGSEYEHVPRVWALAGAVMGIVRATFNEMVGRRSEGPLAAAGIVLLLVGVAVLPAITDPSTQ